MYVLAARDQTHPDLERSIYQKQNWYHAVAQSQNHVPPIVETIFSESRVCHADAEGDLHLQRFEYRCERNVMPVICRNSIKIQNHTTLRSSAQTAEVMAATFYSDFRFG